MSDQPGRSGLEGVPPLRERLPDYAAVFGVLGSGAVATGGVIAAVAGGRFVVGAAYGLVILGTLGLLAGGARGGGYANIGVGAVQGMFGGGRQHDEDVDDQEVRRGRTKARDPYDRLRRGLRPEANPRAFWQVLGGIAYLTIGILALSAMGA